MKIIIIVIIIVGKYLLQNEVKYYKDRGLYYKVEQVLHYGAIITTRCSSKDIHLRFNIPFFRIIYGNI